MGKLGRQKRKYLLLHPAEIIEDKERSFLFQPAGILAIQKI